MVTRKAIRPVRRPHRPIRRATATTTTRTTTSRTQTPPREVHRPAAASFGLPRESGGRVSIGLLIRDEDLTDAARRGDRSAFAQLYERVYPSVYRFAYFHTRSVADAEDAAADAFMHALDHVRQFRGDATQFAGWVMRIARNGIIDRSRRARPQVSLDDVADPPAPDQASGVVDRVTLRAALAKLGEDQRSTVVLRFVIGLSSRETAELLGKSEGAVEQLQRRGLAALATELGEPS